MMSRTTLENPLLEEWRRVCLPIFEYEAARREEFEKTGKFPSYDPGTHPELVALRARYEMNVKYAWAVPNEEALDMIGLFSPEGVVEIGAGTGYWAGLLRARGIEVAAYDRKPHKNSQADGNWSEVKNGGPKMARFHPRKSLFLCWPPYNTPMAWLALQAYRGDTLIYVGEGGSGCTGDDAFHDELDENWRVVAYANIPQWPGIRDSLYIYKRGGEE